MIQHQEKTSENKTQQPAANINRGTTAVQLKDNRQHSVVQQKLAKNSTASGLPIQRVKKNAAVTWGVTHLVQPAGDSLFGEGDGLTNELSPDKGGQLKQGDKLVIDDTPVIISRRGSNQENTRKREKDEEGEKVYEWVQVLAIIHNDRLPTSFAPNTMYVRKETINIQELPKLKDPTKNLIELRNIEDWEAEGIPLELAKIAVLWGDKGRLERRRSTGVIAINKEDRKKRYKGSGRHWEQEDDGWDVAKDMAHEKHKPTESDAKQWRIKAVIQGTNRLVGVLIVEERDGSLYLRWMIGNPHIKGGGTALLSAVKILLQTHATADTVVVTSAYTAKDSYTKADFVVNKDNADEDEDNADEDHKEKGDKEKDGDKEHPKGEEYNLTLSKADSGKNPIPKEYASFKPVPYGKNKEEEKEKPYLKNKKELDEEGDLREAMRILGLGPLD
jgi:hypothetical protein